MKVLMTNFLDIRKSPAFNCPFACSVPIFCIISVSESSYIRYQKFINNYVVNQSYSFKINKVYIT
jgi:hypothetical protein